jgi:quinol monooxygenase YgiN
VYGGIVKLVARPGEKPALLDFLRWDAEVAKAEEPGLLRFDVWECAGEPDVVYLYEAYVDERAFETHMAGAPFTRFVEEIVPTLADPPSFVVPFTESLVSNADA